MSSSRPNVLLIHCHDLGRHLGCYGADVNTPNIDELAAEGARFEEYYSSAPNCSPSRGSIMTGKHPQRNGLMGLTNVGGWDLPRGERCLPESFRDLGYRTHLMGIQHVVGENPGERLGYDDVHDVSSDALDVAAEFADSLDDMAAADDPFFASLGFFEPHRSFRIDAIDDERYAETDPAAIELPSFLDDRPGIRRDMADMTTLIEEIVDVAVGRIRAALQAAGVDDDTLIVFTTDHGLAMPRAKGTLYDPGIGTALLMRCPDVVPAGETSDALLSNVDLFPTLVELAGGDPPENIDGRSFASLLDSGAYEPRREIYASMTWHDTYVPMRSVRTDRYKYVRNYSSMPRTYLPVEVFHSEAGEEMLSEYYTRNRPREELYDLEADPNEEHNLVEGGLFERGSESHVPYEYSGVFEDLRERLDEWLTATDDPILDGDISPPESPYE